MSKEQMISKIVEILSKNSLWIVEQVYRFSNNITK